MSVVESFSCGVPVAASCIGGQLSLTPDFLRRYMFQPRSASAIADSISDFLSLSPAAYISLSDEIMSLSGDYSFASFASSVASTLDSAVPR